ncbi:MAG: 2-C-methyl-D-erythritol 4-phosphate cytidylyltransferase [Verrucomicrobia bacterium]|nr:MAG: 2-C-methyl-D-erythritol 4-phosphate cytidylyltransferase [Verrucomicrobiota bacterium]PYK91107.1 MAG: 2-C-methyl-D-erythritol 4-phosphate cytidylyltransferase [Verrucomicrobiota bacterium]
MLTAIIVAAGSSERMGFDKLFALVSGKPIIAHTIAAFERTSCVEEIILVGRADGLGELRKIIGQPTKVKQIVAGGAERSDSVRAGLDHLNLKSDFVAVHDAARPMITPEKITRVFDVCRTTGGAAALAEPINDTLKRADLDLAVKESVDRNGVYAMQTPQVFARKLLEEAYRLVAKKNVSVTDEVSAVELLGCKVVLVPNHDFNFKITYPRDLPLAEFVLKQRASLPSS